MGRRIVHLKDSPCSKCNKHEECMVKAQKNEKLYDIIDQVFGNMDYNYYECPIYIAITAPDMVDETEVEDG